MTTGDAASTTLTYFGKLCPLCEKRPIFARPLYGHSVCKKCYYAFNNSRQLAFVIDVIVAFIVGAYIDFLWSDPLVNWPSSPLEKLVFVELMVSPWVLLFALKDGISGQSLGKKMTGVQVVDAATHQPIGLYQSFRRNLIFFAGLVPTFGIFIDLLLAMLVGTQMGKGHRIGDRFAGTRVILKKYAHLPVFGGGLVCHTCGYDLSGNVSGICPECGTPVSARNAALLGSRLGNFEPRVCQTSGSKPAS